MAGKKRSIVREYVEAALWAVVLTLILRAFVIQAFRIPSESMLDTLLVGDFLFVNKFEYGPKIPFTHVRLPGLRGPRTGDIIVFQFPGNPSLDYIKRCVAAGGQTVEVRDSVPDNIQLPAVILAYHMPAQGTKDSYALGMLTAVLSGGESSRLTKRLVDKDKLAVMVQAIPLSMEDPCLFIGFSIANFGKTPREVEDVMQQEIDRVQKEMITETELTKIKNQRETEFVQKNSTVQGKAMQLADYYLFFGDTNLINTEIQKYAAVTREDMQRVAQQYLKNTNRTVLYYVPKTQAQ